ncbi:MAG: hypothetical protein WBB07_05600 [Mycobacterium sp.]
MTKDEPASDVPNEPVAAAEADQPQAAEQPVEPVEQPVQPAATPTTPQPQSQQRVWVMPKAPVNRKRAEKLGRLALDAMTKTGKVLAGMARGLARVVTQLWRAIDAIPRALQLFFVAGLLMLLGVAGSVALANTLGLICTVVVIPVCSMTLGALGYRWYSGLGAEQAQQADAPATAPATSDLQRSVEYVDKKLAVALASFGTEHHQQAVIALFQAKTAVELTLGTEQDDEAYGDVPSPVDGSRPRIRVGASSKSLLRESNSLAAS